MNMLFPVSNAKHSKDEKYTPGWPWTHSISVQKEKNWRKTNYTYLSLREPLFSTGLWQCFGAVEGAEWTSKVLAECWGLLHVLGLRYSSHLSKGSSKSLPCGVLITCFKKYMCIYLYVHTYIHTHIHNKMNTIYFWFLIIYFLFGNCNYIIFPPFSSHQIFLYTSRLALFQIYGLIFINCCSMYILKYIKSSVSLLITGLDN